MREIISVFKIGLAVCLWTCYLVDMSTRASPP
jgi:hypothetical protein